MLLAIIDSSRIGMSFSLFFFKYFSRTGSKTFHRRHFLTNFDMAEKFISFAFSQANQETSVKIFEIQIVLESLLSERTVITLMINAG